MPLTSFTRSTSHPGKPGAAVARNSACQMEPAPRAGEGARGRGGLCPAGTSRPKLPRCQLGSVCFEFPQAPERWWAVRLEVQVPAHGARSRPKGTGCSAHWDGKRRKEAAQVANPADALFQGAAELRGAFSGPLRLESSLAIRGGGAGWLSGAWPGILFLNPLEDFCVLGAEPRVCKLGVTRARLLGIVELRGL